MSRATNSHLFHILACSAIALALLRGPVVAQELARVLPMEQQLLALEKTGLPGPVVAVLGAEGRPSPEQGAPTSLKQIAANFGLKVFEQDGVYVIASERRRDFGRLFDKLPLGAADGLDLVHSLSDEQFRQIGSQQGLAFSALDGRQQTMFAAMFRPGAVVTKANDTTDGFDRGPAIRAESLPIQAGRLHGWLEVSDLTVYFPNASWTSISPGDSNPTGLMLTTVNSEDNSVFDPLVARVPNTVKRSDLDYADPALAKAVSFGGRVSLRDFVDRVAKETGVGLRASPGSENVSLFVSASNVPAGRLLKAVSLATTGTWRRFGDVYVFTVDYAGLGQIAATGRRVLGDWIVNWAGSSYLSTRRLGNLGLLAALPYAPTTKFAPSLDQVGYLLDGGNSDGPHLFWSQLSGAQQSFLEQELAKLGRDELKAPPSERAWWKIGLTVKLNVACTFPNTERILLPVTEFGVVAMDLYVGPCGSQGITILPVEQSQRDIPAYLDAPENLRITIQKPLRGYMCGPSSRETADELISTMTKRGFNALYLRVFSNGFAAFDSAQFPKTSDLDGDYLLKVISRAHERGIRVFGVVDVLRWSDGSKGSWVSKRPDLLDYDILGRTHAQFGREFADWIAAQPDPMAAEYRLEASHYGDGLTGDVVSPYSPEVKSKLEGLLEELAKYELDGLMLDYTTMRHTEPEGGTDFGPDFCREGRPGHSPLARLEFFRAYGADSTDILAEDMELDTSPLQPIVKACGELQVPWDALYRKGCDDLLEGLAKKWRGLHGEDTAAASDKSEIRNPKSEMPAAKPPIWVLVTFRAGTESHEWPRFKDLIDGVVISGTDFPGTGGTYYGFKSVPIVRASGEIGTLPFASNLASGLGLEFQGMSEDSTREKPWESEGVIVDVTSAGRRKTEYLKLIAPPAENR